MAQRYAHFHASCRTRMRPRTFAVSIGGYLGTFYSVEFKRGSLLYTCWRDRIGEKYRVTPSRAAWARFWRRLDEIGFWSWGGAYNTPRIFDGTSWSVEVAAGLQYMRAHGCNAYPPRPPGRDERRVPHEMTPEFAKFCEAISDLLGGHAFG
jgi:hypothetical protein